MLSKKQNLIETITPGGKPDRFVDQYEALGIVATTPFAVPWCEPGGPEVKNGWGVTQKWIEGTPGQFPLHDDAHLVCKDIEHWKDDVHAPDLSKYTAADWEPAIKEAEQYDGNDVFISAMQAPGIFEQCHYLTEIKRCMMYFVTNPDDMHELIKYITDWELQLAEQWCTYVKPEGLFHHDDWGTQMSTFLSPDMFAEFYLEPYKQVYGYYKDHGVKLVVHHSDCYAATLVPYMIEMGIDIWQGGQSTDDFPALIKEYGGKISFMAGIDDAIVDKPDWDEQHVREVTRQAINECAPVADKHFFIPCLTHGLGFSIFDGVYATISDEIAKMSKEMF